VNSAVEKRIAATPKRERTTFWKISTPTTATMDGQGDAHHLLRLSLRQMNRPHDRLDRFVLFGSANVRISASHQTAR
jgi:hypothetical protein